MWRVTAILHGNMTLMQQIYFGGVKHISHTGTLEDCKKYIDKLRLTGEVTEVEYKETDENEEE